METKVEPIPIKQKIIESVDQYCSLPDLYIRKYLLCEKLQQQKKHYIPQCDINNKTNQQIQRPLFGWGQIVADVVHKAYDVQERKKWKIGVKYQLAKEASSKVNSKFQQNDVEALISAALSHQVIKGFQYESDKNDVKLVEYFKKMNTLNSVQELDETQYKNNARQIKKSGLNFDFLPQESETEMVEDKKNYENFQEALQLFILQNQDFKQQFDKTINNIDGFPTSLDQINQIQKRQYYQEATLEQDYEELIYKYRCTPELVLKDGERMMKKIKIFGANQPNLDQPLPNLMDVKDLFRYKYHYIERDSYFLIQGTKVQSFDQSRFTNHHQQINKNNPIVKYYFLKYLSKFNGDYSLISAALSSNPMTQFQYHFSVQFCQDLYAYYIYQKEIPSNTKFLFNNQYFKSPQFKESNFEFKQNQQKQTNIIKNYEELINVKNQPQIKHQHYQQTNSIIPSIVRDKIQKQSVVDLLTRIKKDQFVIPKRVGNTSAEYALIEKISIPTMKQTIERNIQRQPFYIEKRFRTHHEQLNADRKYLETFLKKPTTQRQIRPPQMQMPPQRPLQPVQPVPQAPPQQFQQMQQPIAPPQQPVQPPPPPLVQQGSGKKGKAAEKQAAQAAQQAAQAAAQQAIQQAQAAPPVQPAPPQGIGRRKAGKQQQAPPPVPEPVAELPQPARGTRKNNSKKKKGDQDDEPKA
ncbi:hypothetical protein pb186bvf_002078 [Paramecium bursaria]